MLSILWLIPAFPLAGFLLLAFFGARMPKFLVNLIGAGSVGGSFIVAMELGLAFLKNPPKSGAFSSTIYNWISVGGFNAPFGLYLDALSLVMISVVTFVGFLIMVYSTGYMAEEKEGYSRFFAYMNLFVAAMLTLVLADNLVLLFVGWEGVGVCSYLLIGFWYQDTYNIKCAQKAFVVTRLGDAFMSLGIFLLYQQLGSLNIQTLMHSALDSWKIGAEPACWVAGLLLLGAIGKSAQLPLQTWLPDAMAGPTPVSALLHSSTMVTAGFYLIARTHFLFALAPEVQHAVALVGAATLVFAGFAALCQRDIKRILAYSTISQIGYMFLALGVGAWSAAVFHFFTHAFFKALLFMGAGAIIVALHHEQDISKMGGLRKSLPWVFWPFLIGCAALAGFPLLTAGFYSKDLILWSSYASEKGGQELWAAGILGAFMTGLYAFRLIFVVFFGKEQTHVHHKPGFTLVFPLIILAIFSVTAGFLDTPESMGNYHGFTRFLETALPAVHLNEALVKDETVLQLIASGVAIGGLLLAAILYLSAIGFTRTAASTGLGNLLRKFWLAGWGFDWIYDHFVVNPIVILARLNKADIVDIFYRFDAFLVVIVHRLMSRLENGKVRWYAAALAIGAIFVLTMTVFL